MDKFDTGADDSLDTKQKNPVHVKKDSQFCGINFIERRMVESLLIQAFGRTGNLPCISCEGKMENKGSTRTAVN